MSERGGKFPLQTHAKRFCSAWGIRKNLLRPSRLEGPNRPLTSPTRPRRSWSQPVRVTAAVVMAAELCCQIVRTGCDNEAPKRRRPRACGPVLLIFGVASLLLSMVGLSLAFAYGNDSIWALVVIYIAFWPNLALSLFLPNVGEALFIAPIGFIFWHSIGWLGASRNTGRIVESEAPRPSHLGHSRSPFRRMPVRTAPP